MRRLRVVLVATPSLPTELARRALTERTGLDIIAEFDDTEITTRDLADLSPDVVIVIAHGSLADALHTASSIRSRLPHARMVTLSADLKRMLGPGEDQLRELTIDALLDALTR